MKYLKFIIPLVVVAILAGVVISNGGPVEMLRNMLGLSSQVQETETKNWAVSTTDPIMVPE